jgi:hypothetical protein
MDPEIAAWGQNSGTELSSRRANKLILLLSILAGAIVATVAYHGFHGIWNPVAKVPVHQISEGESAVLQADAAEAMLTQFLEADSIEGRAALVRHPEITIGRTRKKGTCHYFE